MSDQEADFVLGPVSLGPVLSGTSPSSHSSEQYWRRMRFFRGAHSRHPRLPQRQHANQYSPVVRRTVFGRANPMDDRHGEGAENSSAMPNKLPSGPEVSDQSPERDFPAREAASHVIRRMSSPRIGTRQETSEHAALRALSRERFSSQTVISPAPSSPFPSDGDVPDSSTWQEPGPGRPIPREDSSSTSRSSRQSAASDPPNGHDGAIMVASVSSRAMATRHVASPTRQSQPADILPLRTLATSVRPTATSDLYQASSSPASSSSLSSRPTLQATPSGGSDPPAGSHRNSSSTSDPVSDESAEVSFDPNTAKTIGGAVGGIGGAAIILLLILFLLHRLKQRRKDREGILSAAVPHPEASQRTSTRLSHTPLVRAMWPFKQGRPESSHTSGTVDTALSDRGFQRVAGRKIDPVLLKGGDGYGGNYGAFEKGGAHLSATNTVSSASAAVPGASGVGIFRHGDQGSARGSRASSALSKSLHGLARSQRDLASVSDAEKGSPLHNPAGPVMAPDHLPSHPYPSSHRFHSKDTAPSIAPTSRPSSAQPSHEELRGSRFTENV